MTEVPTSIDTWFSLLKNPVQVNVIDRTLLSLVAIPVQVGITDRVLLSLTKIPFQVGVSVDTFVAIALLMVLFPVIIALATCRSLVESRRPKKMSRCFPVVCVCSWYSFVCLFVFSTDWNNQTGRCKPRRHRQVTGETHVAHLGLIVPAKPSHHP